MKKYLVLLFFPLTLLAQEVKVSGTVLDRLARPVSFAQVIFVSATDSTLTKTTWSEADGHFEVRTVAGPYFIKINAPGFSEYRNKLDIPKDTVLEAISLNESAIDLDNVVIDNKRPVIRRKIDRLEFDVENSVLSSTNAWEILGKTPGVKAASDGTLTVRGSSGILVTINDKKIYLSGEELKQLLENTNGEDIKSVEVITNPPAKYEAQGSTVLNIRMKKNSLEGYKGTISSAYVQSMYAKGVISSSNYYKSKKLSLYGGYTFGSGTYIRQGKDVVYYSNDEGETVSKWVSTMNRKNKSLAQNGYRLNGEYAIDSLTTVTAGTDGFFSPDSHGLYNVPTYIYNAAGQLDSLYTTRNKRNNPARTANYNAGVEHAFSNKGKLSFSSDYTRYFNGETQDIRSSFALPQAAPYRTTRFVSDNTQRIRLFSAQADYSVAKDSSTFETGARFGKVKADNNLDYKDEFNGNLVDNPGRTGRFLYDEAIYAGYVSYSRDVGKWSFKAGLRGEYTWLRGNSVTIDQVNRQDYFKLFPTLYAMYKPAEGQEIGISYGKRINRPQYSWLNPFRSYYNSYSYFTGDPALKPAVIHNISLLYTLKSKYNFDLYYRYSKNPSMEISFQDYATTTVIYKFTNIRSKVAYGLDFNTNLELFPWLTSSLQVGGNFIDDTFQGIDGHMYSNTIFSYSGSVDNRFVLDKKSGFTAEIDWSYNSPSVQGTFTISHSSSLAVGLNKKVLKDRGEIIFLFSDLYRGEKQRVTTNYANQYNYFDDYSDTQRVRIGFKYNFGNQVMKNAAVKESTEEQQRL